MVDGPRGYDREYLRPLPGPVQVRIGVTTELGTVTRFLVQLEYWSHEEWVKVFRYDHDPGAPEEMAPDVNREGLHVDIYRRGEKHATEFISGSLRPGVALDLAGDPDDYHAELRNPTDDAASDSGPE